MRKERGITLVALVVTIVVLLILAGVTIAMVLGQNGIFGKAETAKHKTVESQAEEKVKLSILDLKADREGKTEGITPELIKEKTEGATSAEPKETFPSVITVDGVKVKVDENGRVSISNGVANEEIFDESGEIDGKLHIGDFINYTAGDWTDGQMSKIAETGIAANNSTNKPSTSFQFGGFTNTSSRDGNATPYETTYNYVKDKSTGNAVTGWRLFDVAEDGTITLISAGCPEDYYHPYETNGPCISEYILTGNINSNPNASTLGLGSTYKPRDWSMYVNSDYGATSATALTKAKLDEWYTKYKKITNTEFAFESVYGTNYESLIDNYSHYWLSSAGEGSGGMYCVNPDTRYVDGYGGDEAYGVRILVSLSSNIQVSETSSGTKTVTSRGVDYNYNVWNLEL